MFFFFFFSCEIGEITTFLWCSSSFPRFFFPYVPLNVPLFPSWISLSHDGSVCMPYMVCHLPSIYPSFVSIYHTYGSEKWLWDCQRASTRTLRTSPALPSPAPSWPHAAEGVQCAEGQEGRGSRVVWMPSRRQHGGGGEAFGWCCWEMLGGGGWWWFIVVVGCLIYGGFHSHGGPPK